MMRAKMLLALLCALILSGCAQLGLKQPFDNDPLTGGVDAGQSLLLQVALPAGLQRYPSHSHISGSGRREGLETLRGYVDQGACAMNLYGKLKAAGWQLRMYQRFGYRAIYIYQKDNELAALVFHRQGMLTIIEIWAGARLADNAALAPVQEQDDEPLKSLAPEEYGPVTESQGTPGAVERWGVEERDI